MMHALHCADPLLLESGEILTRFDLQYCTLGTLNATCDNVIWICHAFSANSDPRDWWSELVDDDKLIDPKRHFIVCVNILGSCYGSTGPRSINPKTGESYAADFPALTIRDIVNSLIRVRKHIGIDRIALCIGASMGAQQVLEWAIAEPQVIRSIAVIAAGARQSAWAKAFNAAQRLALEADSSLWSDEPGAGRNGIIAARSIAMISYRNYDVFEQSQSDSVQLTQCTRAESYLRHQGQKLANRFLAQSYWHLTRIMDTHDCARGRGGMSEALSLVRARTLVVGISTDILFPPHEQQVIASMLEDAWYREIESDYGHDGFLVEAEQLKAILQEFCADLFPSVSRSQLSDTLVTHE